MFSIFRRKQNQTAEPQQVEGTASLDQPLARTRASLSALHALVSSASVIDEALLEELETCLLTADMGVAASERIIERVRQAVKAGLLSDPQALLPAVQAELLDLIEPAERYLVIDPAHKPFVILMVGVNGVGKTTTIGKLARRYLDEGLSVMLAAGDTFRAAAVEQLKVWGERNDVPVIAQQSGADSAAVIYDALHAAKARGIDVLIADTAGRLHTQSHLMEELAKVGRVIKKVEPDAPHETLLVVDGGTGQNALMQARAFNNAIPVTGVAVTKLDGTARGGVLFAIAAELDLPIRFVGVGEKATDLRPFDAAQFVHALLPLDEPKQSA